MNNNRNKAAAALGLAVAGFLSTYPFRETFAGGLLHSGFWAAMIGGLADWFAVTALFRKPLGIGYRTAIIPRNRQRIFHDLTEFVEWDLLTADNIVRTVAGYNVAGILIRYLEEGNGKDGAKEIARRVVRDLLIEMDEESLGLLLEKMVRERIVLVPLAPLLARALEWTVENGYDRRVAGFVLDEAIRIAGQEEMRSLLAGMFVEVKTVYERGMKRRRLASYLLSLDPDALAVRAREELCVFLGTLRDPDHPLRVRLERAVRAAAGRLRTDERLREAVETWKVEVLANKIRVAPQIGAAIAALRRDATDPDACAAPWLTEIDNIIDHAVDHLKEDREQQQALDRWAKMQLERFVGRHHGYVARTVRERLEELSDEMLVRFIEERVGNDLQMIRINGSVIGGIAGMLLHLIAAWAEGGGLR